MIATLTDLCLRTIGENLKTLYSEVRHGLPTRFKEMILERLEDDQFTTPNLPYVQTGLFVSQLKRLHFSYNRKVTDTVLESIAATRCQLQYILIEHCPKITERGLRALICNQRKLEHLQLEYAVKKDSGKFLQEISSPALQTVSLALRFDSESLEKKIIKNEISLLRNHKRIKKVALLHDMYQSRTSGIYDKHVKEIASILGNNLESLELYGNVHITEDSFSAIASRCPQIKVFKTDLYEFEPKISHCFEILSHGCRKLEEIYLRNADRFNSKPYNLSFDTRYYQLPTTLRKLTIDGNYVLQNQPLVFKPLVNLHTLEAPMTLFDSSSVGTVFSTFGKKLKELKFRSDFNRKKTETIENKTVAAVVDHCTNLERLEIACMYDTSLNKLYQLFNDDSRACKLRKLLLNIHTEPAVNDFQAKYRQKEYLLTIARKCENIIELELETQTADDELLCAIAEHCQSLRKLGLYGKYSIDEDIRITDRGLCEVALHCPLEYVIILCWESSMVTGKGVMAVANCCPLVKRFSVITNRGFDRQSVEKLRKNTIERIYITHANQ
ncbi:uncharacterized protein [Ptychodera flava]|uniref:uncharacterized protein n=1 Tax=Ptychodera flava TaxID=63121 RepID=UPI003969C24F